MIHLFLPVSVQNTTDPFLTLYPWVSWALKVNVFIESKLKEGKIGEGIRSREAGMTLAMSEKDDQTVRLLLSRCLICHSESQSSGQVVD